MKLEVLHNNVTSGVSRDAPPILCIHGAGCGAWVWRDMLEWFAGKRIPASALSLRGHGGSDGFDQLHEYGVMDYVEDVRSTVAAMDSRPMLVGHSMGGLVVQKLLESWQAPGAVLLASSPVGGMVRDGLRMFARWPRRFTAALLRRSILEIYGSEQSTRWLLFGNATDSSLVAQARRQLEEESWRAILDLAGRVRPCPKKVDTPILVLGGSDDHMVSPASNRRTAAAYGAEVRFFTDCGHMMMLERCWPLVAGAIRLWRESLNPAKIERAHR